MALNVQPSIGLGHMKDMISGWDSVLFKLVNQGWSSPALDHVMVAVTMLGLGIVQSGMSLCLILLGFLLDRVNWRRAGYAGLVAFAFSGAAVQIAKHLWDRPRPLLVLHDVRIVDAPLFAHSFPSGHTTTAFAVMVACSFFLPRLRYVLIPLAFATAISRVYLGVHFPLDVAYGGLMGALIGVGSARLVRGSKPE